jgi:hypothetical protein
MIHLHGSLRRCHEYWGFMPRAANHLLTCASPLSLLLCPTTLTTQVGIPLSLSQECPVSAIYAIHWDPMICWFASAFHYQPFSQKPTSISLASLYQHFPYFKDTFLHGCFPREFDIVHHSSFHLSSKTSSWHSYHSSLHS